LRPIESFSGYQNRQAVANWIAGALRFTYERAVEFKIENDPVTVPNKALSNLTVDLAKFDCAGHAKHCVAHGRTQEFKESLFHCRGMEARHGPSGGGGQP
jgi:hypothetical protein